MVVMVIIMIARASTRSRMHFPRRALRCCRGSGFVVEGSRSRRRPSRRCLSRRIRRFASQGQPTGAAEFVVLTIVMSANTASRFGTESGLDRRILRGGFRIRFHSKALHRLQSSRDRFLIRLGPTHLGIETLIDLAQSGIVRANARHCAVGILRCSGTGWFYQLLVPVFIFLSISICVHVQTEVAYPVILAQPEGISM